MKKALFAATALALVPCAASAQMQSQTQYQTETQVQSETELAGIEFYYGGRQGDSEVTLSGSGSNDKDFESGGFGLSGSYGWYLTDEVMLNIRQSVLYADPGDDDSAWNGSTRVGALYNFDLGVWRPFVGLNVGYLYGDTTDEGFIAGPEVGVRYFVNPKTFVFGQAEYQFLFDSFSDIDNAFDDGSFAYSVGVGFNF
jgi:hypothetical protein